MPAKFTEHSVTIKIRHYPNVMFLRQSVGTGDIEGHEVELSVNVGGTHPIVRFSKDEPNGAYTISWEDILDAVYHLFLEERAKTDAECSTSAPPRIERETIGFY